MENGKTSLNIRKLKKQVQGITLIALVVTIIVLLILAGVAISLTIGQNGIFSRAQTAANTWRNAESNEQLAMGELEDWMDGYMNGNGGNQGGDNTTVVDDVTIPDGFYYAGGSKDTGLVISDDPNDEIEWNEETSTNAVPNDLEGNQFVWVPVANPENYFIDATATLNTNATGTGKEKEVTTNVYSNLTIRSGDQSKYTAGAPGTEKTEEENAVTREPDVLSGYDTDEQYYEKILEFDSPKEMAESFVAEYKAMSNSIKKYNGFYIGRYELSGSVEDPTEEAGASLTNQNWYNLYKACQNVVTGKENVKSTMIYGVQWDATMDWLKATKFQADPSKVDTDSSSWGNYGSSSKIDTGSNTTYEANGIFDLAGNCWEWTQEAYSTHYRVARGGSYYDSGSVSPASDRDTYGPSNSYSSISSRATLYMS